MKKARLIFLLIILLPGLFGFSHWGAVQASALAEIQDPEIAEKVQQVFDSMTPAERVGQLFLVSFQGTNVGTDSNINLLIHNYHIGGVVLMASNNNFTGSADNAGDAYAMIRDLQSINWQNSETLDTSDAENTSDFYVPLLIGISQEGDGYPNDQILSGLTSLPNQMALGAAWSTDLAASTGQVLGKELAALGINLVFGPSLDVLDMDYSAGNKGLGTRSFGENPYWVGKLGQAYIEGIHTGSDGKILVIGTHFPGQGSSDRDPWGEIATISKPYSSLMAEDLAPFFDVTGEALTPAGTVDGLLAGKLRYESLQGTIRNTTRPFFLDSNAIEQVMTLNPLAGWRANGGLLVSDNLGSDAIRHYYDPNDVSFDARQVARNAIYAGMDLLYLDDFIATGDIDQTTTIIRTLEFFQQKYMEDSAFAQHVDTAVKRILTKKFSLYTEFTLDHVVPDENAREELGTSNAVSFEVAQRSITLLHPDWSDYANSIPSAPGLRDRTVFFTDYQTYKQCSTCLEKEMITSDALQRSVIKLYGPDASGDTAQYLLSIFSFNDLLNMLNGEDESGVVEDELRAADWVVFAFMDQDANRPASMALKLLLQKRPDLLSNKYSIAFAFNAPYYLDATEIAKLSAYYAVYSKIETFTEVAARVLFQEIVPVGKLPISLPAVGYDLDYITSPTAAQTISLQLDTSLLAAPAGEGTETPPRETEQGSAPSFRTGDTIPLTTGQILDQNLNPVPDGTSVTFSFSMDGETDFVQSVNALTQNGIAKTEFLIPSEGRLEISVYSGEATNSNKLVLNVSRDEAAVITVIVPTAIPTRTPTPTEVPPTETPTPTQPPVVVEEEPTTPNGADWLFSMILVWGASYGVYAYSKRRFAVRWAIRWALLAAFGGMCAYIDLMTGIFGAGQVLMMGRFSGNFAAIAVGLGVGWLAGYSWYKNFTARSRKITATGSE